IRHAREALLAEQLDGFRAAAAHLAMDDDVWRVVTLRNLSKALRNFAERDERRALDAADFELARLAHVENPDVVAAAETFGELFDARLELRWQRGLVRRRRRHAAELVVIDELGDGAILAAHRARRIAPQLHRSEAHRQSIEEQQPARE